MFNVIARAGVALACAVVIPVAFGHTARAQTPAPRRTPAAAGTPVAFTAHAHGNFTLVTSGNTFSGALQLGMAQRAGLTRIDVVSVKSDTLPIPPIAGVTAVIDRNANKITVWNDVTKQYRVQTFNFSFARPSPTPGASSRPSASPRPTASPRPPRRVTSPLANLDVLELTVKLTGHGTTSGLPTTGLSLDFRVQSRGAQNPAHVSATTQLADEFAVFPMTLDVTVEPGSPGLNAKLAYAVDDLTRTTPPLDRFTLPAGYTQARSIQDVILGRRRTRASPMATALPGPTALPVQTALPVPMSSPSTLPR